MEEIRIEEKEIQGNRFHVFTSDEGCALFDTVPAEFANQWLSAAPEADSLILCGTDPHPKCVQRFLEAHPDGIVYAVPYVLYTLAGILGDGFRGTPLRDGTKIQIGCRTIKCVTVSQQGEAAYVVADAGEAGVVSGAKEDRFASAEVYTKPTVVITYVSGCHYTEMIAEKIAQGLQDSEGLAVRLLDLAAITPEKAICAMVHASGVMLGTPTIRGEASEKVWALLTAIPAWLLAGKPAAVFGSYTWNGDGVPHVVERLRQLKLKLIDNGFAIQYKPGETEMNGAYEYGYGFGCLLQDKPNTHRSKLVKCLVCGVVFDSSLGTCPVCNAGMDKCVPVEDEIINYALDTKRTYLIAGGGTAALTAAEAIRNRDKTGRIIMISAEDCLPINRPMLSKNMVIAARVKDSIAVKEPEWFAENQIEIRLNTRILSINPDRKHAVLSDGAELSYDKLVYAMGAECFVPDMPGKELDGVITVRHLSDVLDIWKRLPTAKRAVVIGGGVLGLEVAAELKKIHLDVTVLELAPKIMSRQLDDETGERLVQAADNYGIPIHTGVTITGIQGETRVTGVQLSDGTVFPVELVVMSCGNRASIDVAREAGVECQRAVVVNAHMETNVPDIYACGDCAQFQDVNYQLWAEAAEQGRVAGANAVGDRLKYVDIPYGASFEGMNTRLFAIGDVGKGGREYKKIEFRDELAGTYRKYWFSDQLLCGGILYGDTDRIQTLSDAILKKSTYTELQGTL